MNLSHLWDSIFFSIDPAKFSSSLPLSLSHSFHHAMKKKKEEGKLLKRKKRVGNARKANENVNQISHLCYLPPPPFHLPLFPPPLIFPLLPDTRPSSRFFFSSTILLFSFTCTCTTTAITTISNCVFVGANTTKAPDTARLFERAPYPNSDYIETTSVQNRYCAGTPTLPDDLLQNSTNLRIPKLFRLSCFPLSLPRYRDTQGLKNNFRDVTELHHHRKDFPFFFCATYPIAFCLCDIEFDRVSIAHYVSEGAG